jgi:L-lactate dehydrogenase (FMN-dependent) and related alpha-hydroxy acid dehydrogenases
MKVIGSGGIRNGLEAAKAIALGADLVSMGLPWFRTYFNESRDAALSFGQTTIRALKTACLLTGNGSVDRLQAAEKLIGPRLDSWLSRFSDAP